MGARKTLTLYRNYIIGAWKGVLLAEADVLGIFGLEGLNLATLWSPPTINQHGMLPSACTATTMDKEAPLAKPACRRPALTRANWPSMPPSGLVSTP